MTFIDCDRRQDIRSGQQPLLEFLERVSRNPGIAAPLDVRQCES
jgi:hypothetical protein